MFLPRHRPRSLFGIACLVLALWVQGLAPAASLRGLAADPLHGAVICGHGPEAGEADGPAQAPAGCAACPLCVGALAAPNVPASPVLAGPADWTGLVWTIPPPRPPGARLRPTAQARAPPASSRSPP